VVPLLRVQANGNRPWAMFQLGSMYEKGLGFQKDDSEALKWYRGAAEHGYALAQFKLGLIYQDGLSVPQDYREAVKWYLLAAEQDFIPAEFNLGVMYHYGYGVRQDYASAADWFQLAAGDGLRVAQFVLGDAYREGRGVERNAVLAGRWNERAADYGYAPAKMRALAMINPTIIGRDSYLAPVKPVRITVFSTGSEDGPCGIPVGATGIPVRMADFLMSDFVAIAPGFPSNLVGWSFYNVDKFRPDVFWSGEGIKWGDSYRYDFVEQKYVKCLGLPAPPEVRAQMEVPL